MNSIFKRTLTCSALALLVALAACNKPQEEPAPITDPAQLPAPTEEPVPAEPAPAPEPEPAPAPAPKPKPKPKPAAPVAQAPAQPPPPPVCYDCGVISNINKVKVQGSGSGAGAVAGGVAGGVAGHQFGGGRGKDVATALGAIAGAAAGHMIEKNVRSTSTYDVTITMEAGGTRVINVPEINDLTVGTPVRLNGNAILPR